MVAQTQFLRQITKLCLINHHLLVPLKILNKLAKNHVVVQDADISNREDFLYGLRCILLGMS